MKTNLSLIDTHCDTAFELYHRKQSIFENDCHVSLQKAEKFDKYTHFFAVWADKKRTDDDCFNDFLAISDNLFAEIEKHSDKVAQAKSFADMQAAHNSSKSAIFLAVEDARILGNKIERLDELKARGVAYLTLLWGGATCIGASHNAEGGLTEFGREVVKKCFELGIVPDVSHANEQVTDEVTELAFEYGKPYMASHSNCYEVFPHTRNLRKRHLDAIKSLGGSVGLNLCPWHVTDIEDPKDCKLSHLMRHVEGFLELGAEDVLGLGCDLDGTDLPDGFDGIESLTVIAEEMARLNYSNELIEKLFWKNHFEFIKNNLK